MDNLPDNTTQAMIDEAGQVPQPSDEALEEAGRELARGLCVQNVEIDDSEVLEHGDEYSIVRVCMTVEAKVYWQDV